MVGGGGKLLTSKLSAISPTGFVEASLARHLRYAPSKSEAKADFPEREWLRLFAGKQQCPLHGIMYS